MTETSFSHQALAPVPLSTVWKRLQDPATWATVAGVDETSDHVHDGEQLTGFRFTTSVGGMTYRGDARVTEARREEGMELAIHTNELTGAITVALAREEVGTALHVVMSMRPAGIFGSMLFPVVRATVSDGFAASVERLAQSME